MCLKTRKRRELIKYTFFISILSVLFLPSFLYAEKVGTGIVDGQIIDIFDDFTWDYQNKNLSSLKCQILDKNISFCKGSNWEKMPDPLLGQLATFATKNGDEYGIIISEPYGLSDGVKPSLMRDAIIFNLANATGIGEADIPILHLSETSFGGLDGERISLQGDLEGLKLTYVYTILIADSVTLQIITYSVSKDYGYQEAEIHESFLETLRISQNL